MKCIIPFVLAVAPVLAGECRVLIDGTGCRTRQLAIERIFEKLPDVEEVTILPRADAPAKNQRVFVVRSRSEGGPTQEELVQALGRRAKYYQILSVTPVVPRKVQRH